MKKLDMILKDESDINFIDKYSVAYHLRDVLKENGYRMDVPEELKMNKVLFVLDKNSVVKASIYIVSEYDIVDKRKYFRFNYKLRNIKVNA